MADLKKTIEILFEGNDQASRKAADVLAQIKAMETQAKATTGGTDDLEKSLDKVGKTGAGISAVNAALVTLALKSLIEWKTRRSLVGAAPDGGQ